MWTFFMAIPQMRATWYAAQPQVFVPSPDELITSGCFSIMWFLSARSFCLFGNCGPEKFHVGFSFSSS